MNIYPLERGGEREREGERIECKEKGKVKSGLSHGIIKRVPL